jgi:cation-transporting ATPase 13A1
LLDDRRIRIREAQNMWIPKLMTSFQVVPTENNGSAEMVRLARAGPHPLWFTFQKLKYVWDLDKKLFRRIQFPVDLSLKSYL